MEEHRNLLCQSCYSLFAQIIAQLPPATRLFRLSQPFPQLRPKDGGEDLFMHQSSIRSDGFRTISEGKSFEFLIYFGDDRKTNKQ
ncbi:cold shock protein 2-like [Pyrus ussuriensis x Pyrus communis]|uniref:Cold shock protein 2-like n=1 Tax=Pyrus ussuriensis x Pyrus communis TaxID=2448454 RepID=A0A5N5HIU7_9ROSA|nr:cold shock protein 2-like [Pyrus ussuriensis x Pyrus communis]